MKLLSLFAYSNRNWRVLFEIHTILLFVSPSCQRSMQFICRSHHSESTLKPLHWNHDSDSCRYQLCISKGILFFCCACFSAIVVIAEFHYGECFLKEPSFQPLISYYLFDPSHGYSLHMCLKICSKHVKFRGVFSSQFFLFLFILIYSFSMQFWT